MGVAVAEDRTPRRGVAGDGERIGGGAGGDEVDRGLGRFEKVADAGGDIGHDAVVAVAAVIAFVGAEQGLHHLGRSAGGVVGGKEHQVWSSMM